jgi:DNA-binding transcriptional MerR regulator
MTAGRTYLSIGDVLTLLRQEFPDVTISKIRFLESQGLVNPERTPSGYRKFYDHDVERLRWVLRQQREHFLPLKVIKGRLEDVGPEDGAAGAEAPSEPGGNGVHKVETRATISAEPAANGGVAVAGVRSTATARSQSVTPGRSPFVRDLSGQLPGFDPAASAGVSNESKSPVEDGGSPGSVEVVAAVASASGPSSGSRRTAVSAQPSPRSSAPTTPPSASGRSAGVHVAGEHGATEGASAVRNAGERGAEKPPPELATRPVSPAGPGSRRFTAAELAKASGLTEPDVSELVAFGILGGRSVGGIVHFDESELAVAELAAAFARFGIEPRHLRMYKHSSDREAGFVEQLVLPLLKQRNPDARKRATEMATELTRLGQGLRAALVQRSLQDLLGG